VIASIGSPSATTTRCNISLVSCAHDVCADEPGPKMAEQFLISRRLNSRVLPLTSRCQDVSEVADSELKCRHVDSKGRPFELFCSPVSLARSRNLVPGKHRDSARLTVEGIQVDQEQFQAGDVDRYLVVSIEKCDESSVNKWVMR